MVNPLRFLQHLKHDPRPKLFGYNAPAPVRALALRGLENRPDSDYLFRHAMRDCPVYAPRVRLLEDWKGDGTWGVDRLFMRRHGEAAADDRALVTTVRNLARLSFYLWTGEDDDGYLDEAAALILDRAREDGSVPFISRDARWTRDEHPSVYSSDHWGGFAMAILVGNGFEDPRIDGFYRWLLENQRADGGWLPEYYARQAPDDADRESLPSHPLHTTAATTALAVHPRHRETESCHRAARFLLRNRFREDLPYDRASSGRWGWLGVPDFGYSALNALSLAADAGIGGDDKEVKDLIAWLAAQQQKDGTWRPGGSRPGMPDESLFLTLRASVAVKRLVDDLVPPPEE
jgi:hypothetical protein